MWPLVIIALFVGGAALLSSKPAAAAPAPAPRQRRDEEPVAVVPVAPPAPVAVVQTSAAPPAPPAPPVAIVPPAAKPPAPAVQEVSMPRPPKLTLVPEALPTPLYPVGLVAKLKGATVGVLKAWLDGQGAAHYEVSIVGTPLGLYDAKSKAVSESFLRDTLTKQGGQPLAADQVFPAGVEVYRDGQGGLIEQATRNNGGEWTYTVKGWPNAVGQLELVRILGRQAA
jgi:hypothetical protein